MFQAGAVHPAVYNGRRRVVAAGDVLGATAAREPEVGVAHALLGACVSDQLCANEAN